ncbi:MAG TPA: class II fumarate hydratase [Clostridia bacterium]|nr:class II fumarate hydratase [Clostridia bacterium]
MEFRVEKDSLGEVQVPADKYWAAQTERSRKNFRIGGELMPLEIIRALATIKKAAAITNFKKGKLDQRRCELIVKVCDEILENKLTGQFPLVVWQTGSGTQTNMNVNEVIANRGNELASEKLLHPNDHVNMSQSSNDVFPSAIHVAAVCGIEDKLLPELEKIIGTFKLLEDENAGLIKVARTHLQDATPIAFSQEISGWRTMCEKSRDMIVSTLPYIKELALGGTAVGTGINAPQNFGEDAAKEISRITGKTFAAAANKFHALAAKDALAFSHGALKALACDLMKIANDIRLMASGPRCGLGEIFIPENEPGSSIMPGKVNPTQCEAITMIAVQVMANDTAVSVAASQGNFELNVFMPLIAYNFLQSVCLLSDGIQSFDRHCLMGLRANAEKMRHNVENSLMKAAALNPYIGYDKAAKVAMKAYKEDISLKDACLKLGWLDEKTLDEIFDVTKMI